MNYQKPIKYSTKQQNVNHINLLVGLHDLKCGCEQPLQHIIFDILQQEPSLKQDKKFTSELQKWLTTTEPGDNQEEDTDVIGNGDLEKLFEEPFGEEDDADTR